MRPSLSTTCQCGSGASGALKSSDRVSTRWLPLVASETLPVLAFTPANGRLVLVWAAAAAVVVVKTNAVTTASAAPNASVMTPLRLLFICSLLFRGASIGARVCRLRWPAPPKGFSQAPRPRGAWPASKREDVGRGFSRADQRRARGDDHSERNERMARGRWPRRLRLWH